LSLFYAQSFDQPSEHFLTGVRRPQVSVIDGNQGYGMVVLHKATVEAIAKAQEHGAGVVGTNNTSTSTGALG
jgi:LDH2 family malate/lactate/ureidoglycolate dehydrogenase